MTKQKSQPQLSHAVLSAALSSGEELLKPAAATSHAAAFCRYSECLFANIWLAYCMRRLRAVSNNNQSL
jgi:hypothetical protein